MTYVMNNDDLPPTILKPKQREFGDCIEATKNGQRIEIRNVTPPLDAGELGQCGAFQNIGGPKISEEPWLDTGKFDNSSVTTMKEPNPSPTMTGEEAIKRATQATIERLVEARDKMRVRLRCKEMEIQELKTHLMMTLNLGVAHLAESRALDLAYLAGQEGEICGQLMQLGYKEPEPVEEVPTTHSRVKND